jgi:hypothetical protein
MAVTKKSKKENKEIHEFNKTIVVLVKISWRVIQTGIISQKNPLKE